MNKGQRTTPGLRVTLWSAVLVSVVMALGAFPPRVDASAIVATAVTGNPGTIGGMIQQGGTTGICSNVVSTGDYTPGPTDGCVLTQGYWKNHWPPASIMPNLVIVSSQGQIVVLTNAQAYNLFGDKLMKQLIAAAMSRQYGAGISSTYQSYYDAAIACISAPYSITSQCSNATNLASKLDTYNNGVQGNPSHCKNGPIWKYICQKGNPPIKGMNCGGYYGTYWTFWKNQFMVDNQDYACSCTGAYFCMTASQCSTLSDSPSCDNTLPCTPNITSDGVVLSCPSQNGLDTSNLHVQYPELSTCPTNVVLRSPFPRAMVNVPINFFLQPLQPNNYDDINGHSTSPVSPKNLLTDQLVNATTGLPTEKGYAAGVWQNLVLTLRSHRFTGGESWFNETVPQPKYTFSDQPWNTPALPSVQTGITATYIYKTSSYGLNTTFGREFDMVNKQVTHVYDLPAYEVQSTTYCGHDWKASVQLAQRNWQKTGSCYQTILYPDGTTFTPAGTSNEGCNPGWVAPGNWVYSWRTYTTDWSGVDMTLTGLSTTYDSQPNSVSGGIFDNATYRDDEDGVNGIWVPVVEVQSVLRGKCVADGTCAPPVAEPGSIAP